MKREEKNATLKKDMQTILIIDDNEINRKILRRILEDSYQVVEAEDGEEGFALLQNAPTHFAAVMLDLIMPKMDGFTFLQTIQSKVAFESLPVIVTTGQIDTENEIKALENGAWDFVSKPYNAKIIKFRLKNAIERSQLNALQQLKYLAEFDCLTGLYNRNRFYQRVQELFALDSETPFVFVRFDIDRFQLVNSFFGMEEGDRLLMYLANQLREYFKGVPKGIYGRFEADVFCTVLPYDSTTAKEDLFRARAIIANYNINYDIVPSFGIYKIEDRTMNIDSMFDKATLAAKACKGNYLDFYQVYEESMGKNLIREQEIVNDMNVALEQRQFFICIQPKYSLRTKQPCGGEALVRWQHPEKGLLSPGEFIPIFEKNGFILKLDYYVWEEVCRLLRRWLDEGKNPQPISVNVSRANLYNPQFAESMVRLIRKYKIPANLLNLELTESAYMDNPDMMKETMGKLQSHGFAILMDDFGSGYSSLNVLKDISVDVLKIDMKFLSEEDKGGRSENIIASVVRMAKWLEIPVIMEGVETRHQVEFLESIGCEYVQGYYFAKPMIVSDYEKISHEEESESYQKVFFKSVDVKKFWENHSQLEIILSNFLQPIVICEFYNDTYEVIRVNQAFHETFGYNNIITTGRPPIETVAPEHRESLLDAFRQAIATRDNSECEYLRYRVNGNPVWLHVKFKYLNQLGNNHLLIGTLYDITQQKEIDAELQRYKEAVSTYNPQNPVMLVVDDIELNRSILKNVFQDKYEILEACDGQEAIEILQEKEYEIDIILLDLVMPRLDGKMFLKYKKAVPELNGIPVIIITSETREEEQIDVLALGANDYIVKPFVPEVVVKRIENVWESHLRFREVIQEHRRMSKEKRNQAMDLYDCETAEHLIDDMLKQDKDNLQHKYGLFVLELQDIARAHKEHNYEDGNQVLNEVATELKKFFHQSDIIARLGGERYLAFSIDTRGEEVVKRNCLTFCRRIEGISGSGKAEKPCCFIGLTFAEGVDISFAQMYETAQAALEEAKIQNQNIYCEYVEKRSV